MQYRIIHPRRSTITSATAGLRRASDGLQRHLSSHDSKAPDPALERASSHLAAARAITQPRLSAAALDRLAADVLRGRP